MNFDCSEVTTDSSAICVFFLTEYGDFVLLVTLTVIFLSVIIDIENDISRIAVSVTFPTGIIVPVVFRSDGWSTNAVIAFFVISGTVMLLWITSAWSFGNPLARSAFDLPCQVWKMDEAMCSIDDHTVVSNEVQPYKMSRQILHYDKRICASVISDIKFECGCCYQFSIGLFATWIWKLGGLSILKTFAGSCCLILFNSIGPIAVI